MTMEFPDFSRIRLILASRSPQRRELLSRLLPGVNFEVIAPISSEEEDLSPLTRWSEIRERLVGIARRKAQLVASQAAEAVDDRALLILAADTTILVPRGETARALEEQPLLQVLGNPPESAEWPRVVRSWFENHYLGKTHWAATAVYLIREDGFLTAQVVTTAVTMRPDMRPWIEWYLATGEPIGKAGGYALQGAASVFVSQVQGSISNVIGLPLECVAQMLMNSHCSSTDE